MQVLVKWMMIDETTTSAWCMVLVPKCMLSLSKLINKTIFYCFRACNIAIDGGHLNENNVSMIRQRLMFSWSFLLWIRVPRYTHKATDLQHPFPQFP